MCMDIEYKNESLGTIKEVKAAGLIVKDKHWRDFDDGDDEEVCLCGVDIKSILEDNDLEWEEEVIFGYIVKS